MDATRTDEEYLLEVIEAVSDAGTDWINIRTRAASRRRPAFGP